MRMIGGSKEELVSLVKRMARGDRDAFGSLYDRLSSLVFTMAMRIMQERSAAEDLLQEVFLQVWRDASSYSPDRGSPEAWIITVTRSRGIDKLRSMRRRERGFVSMEDPAGREYAKVESSAATSDARIMMKSALAQLSETQRRVLELAYFDGLTQSEIAERLKEPLGTVKTRIRAALTRLRELFGAKVA
jgi:RNA polymerase sigma-70 factor (ECF subfamily)